MPSSIIELITLDEYEVTDDRQAVLYILHLMSLLIFIFHLRKALDNFQYRTCSLQSCLYLHSGLFDLKNILNKVLVKICLHEQQSLTIHL